MSILHAARLNAFTWTQDLIIRLSSKCLQWGDGKIPPSTKSRMEKCEDEWKEKLGPLVGFKDRHCPNQITGAMSDLFFSEKNRENVLKAVADLSQWRKSYRREMHNSEKESLRRLLQGINVLGRVGTSGSLVKVLELRRFSIEFHVFIQETWPWILLGESVHRLVDHLWEFVLLNYCRGLKDETEQPGECSHKEERYDRSRRSRKTDLISGLIDTLRHRWGTTDSVVRSFDRKPWCSACKVSGHWTVSCPEKRKGQVIPGSDDELVKDMLCDEGSEPEEQMNLVQDLWGKWGFSVKL